MSKVSLWKLSHLHMQKLSRISENLDRCVACQSFASPLNKFQPTARLRMAIKKAGPVVTDNGNFVIDAPFSPEFLKEPYRVRLF